MSYTIPVRIHHVQLMIPRGRERDAARFYGELLGLVRIERPADMPNPEGLWFGLGAQQLHLGVQDGPPPKTRAHVAFYVDDLGELLRRLADAGVDTRPSNVVEGMRRFHVWDPFGNRLELMSASS